MRAEAARCGVADAVTSHNTPSDDELLRLVSSSSFYVSASLYEGFGIAPIEAIAGGLTPVLSDIKPHRDTIEATGTGMVTSFDDAGVVADGIERLWSERVALEASAREQRRRSTLRFGWAPMAAGDGSHLSMRARQGRTPEFWGFGSNAWMRTVW